MNQSKTQNLCPLNSSESEENSDCIFHLALSQNEDQKFFPNTADTKKTFDRLFNRNSIAFSQKLEKFSDNLLYKFPQFLQVLYEFVYFKDLTAKARVKPSLVHEHNYEVNLTQTKTRVWFRVWITDWIRIIQSLIQSLNQKKNQSLIQSLIQSLNHRLNQNNSESDSESESEKKSKSHSETDSESDSESESENFRSKCDMNRLWISTELFLENLIQYWITLKVRYGLKKVSNSLRQTFGFLTGP